MLSTTTQADKLPSLLTTAQPCFRFSLAEIQSATTGFDDELVIGKGGFGNVYKGSIWIEETSHVVAIKRLDSMSNQGAPEFRAEIEMLSKLRHCNLVSLIGFCDENKEMILVYAYMAHGTLYHHLHKAEIPLTWIQRLKIAVGAARGLDYLHSGVGTQHGVIHRDVKTSNILLDENWEAMISDFGLSKIGPTNQSSSFVEASVSVKGTFGYLDPEYFYTRKLTRKTDVYAFGVVLFELLSGRLAVDERNAEEQYSLVRWAQKCVKERRLDLLVDSNIRGTIFPKCLRRFAQIADRCCRGIPKERPSMTEVVGSLQVLLELQKKSDDSAKSTGFTWKIHKYLVSTTKQNSGENNKHIDQSGTSSQESLEKNMIDVKVPRQHDKKVVGILKFTNRNKLGENDKHIDQSGTSSPTSLEKNTNDMEMPHQQDILVEGLVKFTCDELRRATRNFGNDAWLGDGIYAEVYKGWFDKDTYSLPKHSGSLIAVKRFYHYKQSRIIKIDLKILNEFSHPNLVKLIGYCLENREFFLVYEFMHKGNFQDHLHSGAIARLPLVTKVNIAVGIARAIVFLQNTQDQNGTLSKSRLDRHNILLDKDFTAKLSGYDVTKLIHGGYPRNTRASNNFVIGDYYPGFHPSQLQSNQWGFSVVFAEVLTGKQIFNEDELQKIDDLLDRKMSLVDMAYKCFQICNEVDSESRMLRICEHYYAPACQSQEFSTETFEGSLLSSNLPEDRTTRR